MLPNNVVVLVTLNFRYTENYLLYILTVENHCQLLCAYKYGCGLMSLGIIIIKTVLPINLLSTLPGGSDGKERLQCRTP